MISALLGLAGCGGTHRAAVPASTTTSQPPVPTRPSTTAATTPTTTPTPPTTSAQTTPAPTLGRPTGIFQTGGVGFGEVEPTEVFNGGDPTGDVTDITWSSWGGPEAVGTGVSDYVAADQIVADGRPEPVRIVAFDLGTCNGGYMYSAVEWYFPQHGQTFRAGSFEDVCIGQYWPLVMDRSYQDGGDDGGAGVAHYAVDISGVPDAVRGSVALVSASGRSTLRFGFAATVEVDGAIVLDSRGPAEAGRSFDGRWTSGEIVLDDCDSYLSPPSGATPASCTFA